MSIHASRLICRSVVGLVCLLFGVGVWAECARLCTTVKLTSVCRLVEEERE